MSNTYAPPLPGQPVDRTIVGALAGMEARSNGWVRFSIAEQGRQYPVKVDTKKPEIIQQCQALMGQQVAAQIREQNSDNINPNTGAPYVNRYLNAIGPAGQQQQPMQQQPAQQYQQQAAPQYQQQPAAPQQPAQPQQDAFQPGSQGRVKEMEIMRQTAWKCVSELAAAGVLDPTPIEMVQAAEVAMGYFVYGPARFGVQGHEQLGQQQQPAQQGGADYPPPPPDDDIPF
jgi:hypothetical protein